MNQKQPTCACCAPAAVHPTIPSLNFYLQQPLPSPSQRGRESISTHFHLPRALINVDTESTPLANPGSPALQMSSDVLSPAAVDSAEICRDRGDAGSSAESETRLGEDEDGIAAVTELAKSRLRRSEPTSLHFQLPACYWRPNRDA